MVDLPAESAALDVGRNPVDGDLLVLPFQSVEAIDHVTVKGVGRPAWTV